MDFSRRLYRWASEGVDMYDVGLRRSSASKIPTAPRAARHGPRASCLPARTSGSCPASLVYVYTRRNVNKFVDSLV